MSLRREVAEAKNGETGNFFRHSEFDTVDDLLEHVTKQWRDRWVMTDICDEGILDALLRRPFFILVSIDAPITLRWQRYKARYEYKMSC